ncbi:MAG: lecithin retinol acyltransferase family protein [Planctomycetia bacterium]
MARGDRLGVERRFLGGLVAYRHMGIDVGDGTVVHARPDDFQRPFGGGRVVQTSFEEFAGGAEVTVVTDPPAVHPPDEVARRALARVGRDGYCPVVDNCEHLATWCATGRHRSRQVEAALALAAAAVVWVGGTAARAALARGRAPSA